MKRFFCLAVILAGCLWGASTWADPSQNPWAEEWAKSEGAFDFKNVVAEARRASTTPYKEPQPLTDILSKWGYDQWRDIRFKPEAALWRDEKLPFQVQFFHPGFLYKWPVQMAIVENGKSTPLEYSTKYFTLNDKEFPESVDGEEKIKGFAGFRIHTTVNSKDYFDEMIAFLGASYFRGVGPQQMYGLSARGLAVNTALETGEEFPFFKKFWIVKPERRDKQITVYALLDSRRVSGAYEFVMNVDSATVMKVRSALFFREDVPKLGVAPITSMFFYGEHSPRHSIDDFRPEVHDSDGLFISFVSGERLWRPLVNPRRLFINTFRGDIEGFGLLQRDTVFNNYLDLEARYDVRPSVWVTPTSDWGEGHVELVQIPTTSEIHDNITTYWVPDEAPKKGEELYLSYDLAWRDGSRIAPPLGQVMETRLMRNKQGGHILFILDFEGEEINQLPADARLVAGIDVINQQAEIFEQQLYKNKATGGWRLAFRLRSNRGSLLEDFLPTNQAIAELRALLRHEGRQVTETWSYAIQI